jgi:anti-anti-sigma regulatory factor
MSSNLVITVVDAQGKAPVTVFRLKGSIDTNTYIQLQSQADEAYRNGTRNLLLDLTEVDYVSSAGLRAIHYIYTILRSDSPGESDEAISSGIRAGTYMSPHLKLLNPSRNVREVLKTAGFDMYIGIFDNLQKAVASF